MNSELFAKKVLHLYLSDLNTFSNASSRDETRLALISIDCEYFREQRCKSCYFRKLIPRKFLGILVGDVDSQAAELLGPSIPRPNSS